MKYLKGFLVFLFGCFLFPIMIFSQKPPCTDGSEYSDLWKEFEGLTFKTVAVHEFPFDNPDMPDSIRAIYSEMVDFFIDNHPDSIKKYCGLPENKALYNHIMSDFYRVIDYDPYYLFDQNYAMPETFNGQKLQSNIWNFFADYYFKPFFNETKADSILNQMLVTSYNILQVKILSNKTMVSKFLDNPGVYKWGKHTTVTALVEEIIKGKTYPTFKDTTIPDSYVHYIDSIPRKKTLKINDTIQFAYFHFDFDLDPDSVSTVGDDYIVFLYPNRICRPNSHYPELEDDIYFTIVPAGIYGYSIMINVNDSTVLDPKNVMNLGIENSLGIWKDKLRQKIGQIVSDNMVSVRI